MTDLALQRETLDGIVELAQEAAGVVKKLAIVPIPNHPRNAVFIVDETGARTEYEPPAKPRAVQLKCIDQVGAFALHALNRWEARPAVYYNESGVMIRLWDGGDEAADQDHARYQLVFSDAWTKLKAWADKPDEAWKKHSEFMRILRLNLGDCFEPGNLDALGDAIGTLNFVQAEKYQSVAVRNRESMGSEVLHEVKAATGDIPEEILLKVRIYRDPVLTQRHEMWCLLETDPVNGRLALIPKPGEIDAILDKEMSNLGDMLRANVRGARRLSAPSFLETTVGTTAEVAAAAEPAWQIPVFYGTP